MTSISAIARQQPVSGREPREADAPAADTVKIASTALVPVSHSEPPHQEDGRRSSRRSASFLAQLIANEQQLPQTRVLRRAEPQVAQAAYVAAAQLRRRAR